MISELTSILGALIGRPDGNVAAELHLSGKTYSVSQFNVSFSQRIDQLGEPQSESMGGKMMITIPQLADGSLLQWAAGSKILKSGEIVFKNETESTNLRIMFENAYCTSMKQNINSGSSCSFVISPQKVSLNGELLDNDWD